MDPALSAVPLSCALPIDERKELRIRFFRRAAAGEPVLKLLADAIDDALAIGHAAGAYDEPLGHDDSLDHPYDLAALRALQRNA